MVKHKGAIVAGGAATAFSLLLLPNLIHKAKAVLSWIPIPITNSTFEKDLAGWKAQNVAPSSSVINKQSPLTGAGSLNQGGRGSVFQEPAMNAVPGRIYKIEADVKTIDTGKTQGKIQARIGVVFENSNGKLIEPLDRPPLNAGAGLVMTNKFGSKHLEGQWQAPAGATRLRIRLVVDEIGGLAEFDNVKLSYQQGT